MKNGWREGNQIQLLENGDQYYPAVFDAIAQAQQKLSLRPLSGLKMRSENSCMPPCSEPPSAESKQRCCWTVTARRILATVLSKS